MKKILISALMLTIALGASAQKSKSLQANVLYGSKVETVGFGLAFNFTGQKHEFSPSLTLYAPKDGVNVKEINFDYHRLYGIGDNVKIFPILGFGINVWENDNSNNATKVGANIGLGGRYSINDRFDAGFQLRYSAMSESASQTVPMLTLSYKL